MKYSIKNIILDVDGVIVGEKIGTNSPNPHPDVSRAMKEIQNGGIPISLCTAKPHFAIGTIIRDAHLDNVHITDGGGVIIDPLDNIVVKKHTIPTDDAKSVIEVLMKANIYTEFYTTDDYFIEAGEHGSITDRHAHVIQSYPQEVVSLLAAAEKAEITKIMPIALNEADKARVQSVFDTFKDKLVLSWGVHPVILPLQFGIITAPGISKTQGAVEIAKSLNIPLENTLAVGDSESDWQFMELCGYVAVMGNAKQVFKDMAAAAKGDNCYIAPSVDDNGILEVFRHYNLL